MQRKWMIVALAAALCLPQHALALDCPVAKPGGPGFVIENARGKTEVFYLEDNIVRTVFRAGGKTILETTEFEGLLTLERVDRERRTIFRPTAPLASHFPLKPRRDVTAAFDVQDPSGRTFPTTITLKFVAPETMYIGPCKYNVIKLARSEARNEHPVAFLNFDYYAPDLKLVIAKEFKEERGPSTLIKYDTIYSLKR